MTDYTRDELMQNSVDSLVSHMETVIAVTGRHENCLAGYSRSLGDRHSLEHDEAHVKLSHAYVERYGQGVGDTANEVRQRVPENLMPEKSIEEYREEGDIVCSASEENMRLSDAYDRSVIERVEQGRKITIPRAALDRAIDQKAANERGRDQENEV